MSPDTVHLIVNLIRHQKGVMTAIEKWIAKQPPCPCRTIAELSAATVLMRSVLEGYEAQISRVDVSRDEVSNAQVSEPALVTGE